ncbi:MAG: tRNA lysidine(34) synthetase TilS [Eggerthellaceae bacterium]|nr:tRNA lysidine(34) synthetase TilS [Eggerthellaceae bacterium]
METNVKKNTQSIEEKTLRALSEHGLADKANSLLLMVSGGSDSCGLAYVMHDLSQRGEIGPLAMLHVNHCIRGQQADDDQRFVEALADALGLPLFVCSIDIPALVASEGGNLEAIARRERYAAAREALRSMCAHEGIPYEKGRICVAHTQNDRVENFYMRSIVGTGPGGLAGMTWHTGNVIRPLLGISRDEIRAYIEMRAAEGNRIAVTDDEGALWREDATNDDTEYFRAYVRSTMIPLALEKNPNLFETLCRTMDLVADEDAHLENLAEQAIRAHVNWIAPSTDPLLDIMGGILPDMRLAVVNEDDDSPDYSAGCVIAPAFGAEELVIRRRTVFDVLSMILPEEMRVENASVQAVLDAWDGDAIRSGYVANIQGNLAISANKRGVRIEPMEAYRARRKKL